MYKLNELFLERFIAETVVLRICHNWICAVHCTVKRENLAHTYFSTNASAYTLIVSSHER